MKKILSSLLRYSILLIIVRSLPAGDAPEWTEIILLETNNQMQLNASSALNCQENVLVGKYGVSNVFDFDLSTAWVEGVEGEGVHETVYFRVPAGRSRLNIMNGYAKTKALYRKNNRVRTLKITCYAGVNPEGYVSEMAASYKALPYPREWTLFFPDTCKVHSFTLPLFSSAADSFLTETLKTYKNNFSLPAAATALIIKLEIQDVYKGSKWDDTCISEIFFDDVFMHNSLEEKYTHIDSVYVNKDENAILLNSDQDQRIKLFQDTESVFQIIDTSADHQWAIVIRMSADPSPRHQTNYLLLNTFLGEFVNDNIHQVSGHSITGPLFFQHKKDTLYLEYYTAESSQSKRILLK